jgi:hypothetical protein
MLPQESMLRAVRRGESVCEKQRERERETEREVSPPARQGREGRDETDWPGTGDHALLGWILSSINVSPPQIFSFSNSSASSSASNLPSLALRL